MVYPTAKQPAGPTNRPPQTITSNTMPATTQFPTPPDPIEGFSIRLLRSEGLSVIRLAGKIDLEHCGAFSESLLGMLDRVGEAVVIELTNLRFINVVGLGVIVRLGNAVHARGGRMMLHNAAPPICRLIRAVRLHELFPPLGTVNDPQASPAITQLATCA